MSGFRNILSLKDGKYFPLIFIFIFYPLSVIFSQDPLVINRVAGEIRFDGIPDESAWENIIPLQLTTLQPVKGKDPSERTEILIGYSNDFLWIGGRFFDSDPSLIQTNTKKRDDIGEDSDLFRVLIDCMNDNQNGFVFGTSPSGHRLDMAVANDARIDSKDMLPFNVSWNTFWDVETVVTEEGWFTEIRIPFSSLRFRETPEGVTMGLTAYRWIPRKNELIVFPELDPKFGKWVRYQPSHSNDIMLKGIKPANPVYITPYLLGGWEMKNDLSSIDGNITYKKSIDPALEAGLDVKYSLNSNLTLDLTLNTDFAQVEDDELQVNISRFDTYYPEKRLFFQERADIFSFNLGRDANLFYSREIGLYNDSIPVRIFGGARLTGKIGKFDVGLINMQTQKLSAFLESENFNVIRLKHSVFNPYSYAGGMFTSRIGVNGSYNLTYGIDGNIRAFGYDYIDLKFAQSLESGREYNRMADRTFARIFWEKRNNKGWGYRNSASWSGSDFNPGIGFLQRENVYTLVGRIRYGWVPPEKSPLFTHQVYFKCNSYFNTSGYLETIGAGPGWQFETKNKFTGEFEPEFHREIIVDTFFVDEVTETTYVLKGMYSFFSLKGALGTPSSAGLNLTSQYEIGQYYDGSVISLSLKPAFSISRSIRLEGQYLFNNIRLPHKDQKYLAHVFGFKFLYMFSTRLTASAFVQYNSAEDIFLTNLRVRYNPREGNDFYIVFNEGRNTDIYRTSPELPRVMDETIQIKYSHTFRF